MEYKDTLLMPRTDFEMRGNLPSKEPIIQAKWEESNLYEQMLENRKGAKQFVFHDGPPYANGNIHNGHALNKILKDLVVRSRFMSGYNTPYIPGWDTHGLPIETAIQKLGTDRKSMSTFEFRKLCYAYALQQVEIQKEGIKKLGTLADFKHPYLTLQKEFEANQIEVFGKMALSGMIYKGLKPVYWSPSSESALAEAEIEYHDKKDATIFVAFNVTEGCGVLQGDERFVIWTTTPWTIPANLAICLNAEMEYAVVDTEKGKLIFLLKMVDELCDKFKLEKRVVLKTFKGSQLEGIKTKHPFYDRESIVILGDHVTDDAGTGCVHTAPGHGVDDFIIGQKYGLEAFCPVDEKGCLTAEAGEFLEGLFVDDANKVVTKRLEELGALLSLEFITHSYPHDWRTKKPIIYRATTQWFASIEKIRPQLLKEIDRVSWKPAWGKQRMHNMIKDRGDWCISRQRVWGVPIPIFYGEDGTPIMDELVFQHIADLFREHGSNIWFEKEAKDLLPEGYTHLSSPHNEFKKETDIMDVWFDSGSSHTGVLKERGFDLPSDLYLEGSDQYRGWFNSSLIISVAVYGHAPYNQVVSHGFILDDKGDKMSKSMGNAIDPSKICNQYGADILRLWVASVDYQADVRISDDILKQVSESYRKVRNTFRFALGNLNHDDFTKKDLVDIVTLPEVDSYMLAQLNKVITTCKNAYLDYDFSLVSNTLINFMTNEVSAYYLDFTKDILYIEKKEAPRRRQVQTVIYHLIHALVRLWAPILAHTSEEVWSYFTEDNHSVHLQDFPELFAIERADEIVKHFAMLLQIRSDVLKALEEARNNKIIGKSLEASIEIELPNDSEALLEQIIQDDLAQWLIVSKAVVVKNSDFNQYEVCKVKVEKCAGHLCPRCWNIVETVDEEGCCPRCHDVLNK